eukprot:m.69652 g.69652  ORF g.69652 m.69652 type:complete len:136 (+) comp12071_c0_seq1:459-866(+)
MTASHYPMMQKLHEKYHKYESTGLDIVAFPCNQFGSQEPGTDAEIKAFAQNKFGVQFKMMSKIDVNGDNAHPLYTYLKNKVSGTLGNFIKWNFTKFLVNHQGVPTKRYFREDKNDLEADIKAALDEALKASSSKM